MKHLTPLFACALLLAPVLSAEPAAPAAHAAQQALTPIKLEFLRVHPQSEHLIAEGSTEVPGYQLAPRELFNEEGGEPHTRACWIETAEAATAKGCYICQQDVARAEGDPARSSVIDLGFTAEGADKMQRLTSSFELGRDRLAIVLNGKVLAAPVVQDVITTQTSINSFQRPGERDAIVSALQAATANNPLPEEDLRLEPVDAEEDNSFVIPTDPTLTEAEQQAVHDYIMQRLLSNARLLRQTYDREGPVRLYGSARKQGIECLKTVSFEKLPADYQTYIRDSIRLLEAPCPAFDATADMPVTDLQRSPEHRELLSKAIQAEMDINTSLGKLHPKVHQYIGIDAIMKAQGRLIARPVFQDACMAEMFNIPTSCQSEEEQIAWSTKRMAELMEAELRYLLGEDVVAPSNPPVKPAMEDALILSIFQWAHTRVKEVTTILKGVTDKASADAAVEPLEAIEKQIIEKEKLLDTYEFPTREELTRVLGPLGPEIERSDEEMSQERRRVREADYFHSDSLRHFMENSLYF